MTKVPLLPLVSIVYTLNYLNLSDDGVVIGSAKGLMTILSEHKDGDFVYAQIACEGDLPFAKYTQESIYKLRSEFPGEIPAEATFMQGAIIVNETLVALEGEPHEPVGKPHVTPSKPGAIKLSGRMMTTANHVCRTFQVETALFVNSTFFMIRGAAFMVLVKGDRIG